MKRIIFITLILISIQISNQAIEFIPEKIEVKSGPCSELRGKYGFNIIGSFNDSASSIDTIFFDVETSDGRKLNTQCMPFSSEFVCNIEVRYPLDKMDILLPTKTPIV